MEYFTVEDVDADEASPLVADPSDPEPRNRDGLQIFVDGYNCVSTFIVVIPSCPSPTFMHLCLFFLIHQYIFVFMPQKIVTQ